MKGKTPPPRRNIGVAVFVGFMVFVLLFTYSSLNLKSIDFGYKMETLKQEADALRIEIDKLRASRAFMINLERVDTIAREQLKLLPPREDQVIRVSRGES